MRHLCRESDVSVRTISRIERAPMQSYPNVGAETLMGLAGGLDVPVELFFLRHAEVAKMTDAEAPRPATATDEARERFMEWSDAGHPAEDVMPAILYWSEGAPVAWIDEQLGPSPYDLLH